MRTIASCLLTLAVYTSSHAQGVTYSLGTESAVLDAAYYVGEAIDGSDVAGRQVLYFAPSHDGLTIAFTAVRNDNSQNAIFLVDVGDPSSWRRLSTDRAFSASAIYWTPDQSHLIWGANRVNVETGAYNISFSVHGNQSNDRSITNLPSNNWMVSSYASNGSLRDLVVLPVLPDGSQDLSRARIGITNLQLDTSVEDFSWPSISPDGKQLTFSRYVHQTPVLTIPDLSDVFALPELDKIIDAAKSIPKPIPPLVLSPLAPTSFSDPAFVEIRASDTPNFAHCMRYSQDASLIFICEDFNNVFNLGNFFSQHFCRGLGRSGGQRRRIGS